MIIFSGNREKYKKQGFEENYIQRLKEENIGFGLINDP